LGVDACEHIIEGRAQALDGNNDRDRNAAAMTPYSMAVAPD